MQLVVYVIAVVCCVASVHAGIGWNYEHSSKHGPEHWVQDYPHCGGMMQSPIDIVTKNVLYDRNLDFFDLSDYSKTDGITVDLTNVGGHTTQVTYYGTPLYAREGSLPEAYQLDQFHFHWGQKDSRGSEHAVDGHHYPMEMHVVHHMSSLTNMSEAAPLPYGLAVIAFFFEIGPHNSAFDSITDRLHSVPYPGNTTSIPMFKLIDLLPTGAVNQLDYYRYMGSLTTPPCYESAFWTLSTETIKLSEAQMDKFRSLYGDTEGHHLVDDFRPLQKMNHRTVTTTSAKLGNGNFAVSITSSTSLLLLSFACLGAFRSLFL